MEELTLPVGGMAPGLAAGVALRRFGAAGARPLAYVQAGLHADEVPPMLVAHHLTGLLRQAEAAGRMRGCVVVAPAANPIGLGQRVLQGVVGRFDAADGRNFNRGFPWLGPAVAAAVDGRLGPDGAANAGLVRAALEAALAAVPAARATARLKNVLLARAIGADLVLDLHCGSEAVQHLYTLTPLAGRFAALAGDMGARAVVLADESGDDPFDEACSRPWAYLRERFPDHPVPLACAAATLEFRGQQDVDHALAASDAAAVMRELVRAGMVAGDVTDPVAGPVPVALAAVALEAAEPLVAGAAGMLVFLAAPGAVLAPGAVVAEIIHPLTGATVTVPTAAGGVLYTRTTDRFVLEGARLGTVAGSAGRRSGSLLSD